MANVVIAGAGVLGSAIAWRLAEAGHSVTIADPAPGGLASPGSFAWLNASMADDPVYNRLRHDSLEIWRTMKDADDSVPVTFPGAMLWEQDHFNLPAIEGSQHDLGRPVAMLDRAAIAAKEPALAEPPEKALLLAGDGYGDPLAITGWFLDQALAAGATLRKNAVERIETDGTRITGVTLADGTVEADRLILAAGIKLTGLLDGQGLTMAMHNEPGLLARTTAGPKQITAMLATPDLHIWQGDDGTYLIGADFGGHQSLPDEDAEAVENLGKLKRILPGSADVDLASVTVRKRPKPADGRPAIGPLGPDGLYVVCTHSGMTLAPVIAEMVTAEIGGAPDQRLAPYRPDRKALRSR
ncbi:MAG: FAD-dependent oxidoreductase [Pseudomonadota bacterium]